jgi:hypothetical protein
MRTSLEDLPMALTNLKSLQDDNVLRLKLLLYLEFGRPHMPSSLPWSELLQQAPEEYSVAPAVQWSPQVPAPSREA